VIEVLIFTSIIAYLMVGAFIAGRTYMHLRLRKADFQEPGPIFLVLFSFVLWWLHLIICASIWSAKWGLTSSDNRRLFREVEQEELQRRIARREREIEKIKRGY